MDVKSLSLKIFRIRMVAKKNLNCCKNVNRPLTLIMLILFLPQVNDGLSNLEKTVNSTKDKLSSRIESTDLRVRKNDIFCNL